MARIKPETEEERAQREHEELGEILETMHDMDATPEPVVKAPKQAKKTRQKRKA